MASEGTFRYLLRGVQSKGKKASGKKWQEYYFFSQLSIDFASHYYKNLECSNIFYFPWT